MVLVWFKNVGVDKWCFVFSCKVYEVENKCIFLLWKKVLNRKVCGYFNLVKKEESLFKDCMLESLFISKKMFDNCLFDFCYYYDDLV